jgi:CBS domain-containing protein
MTTHGHSGLTRWLMGSVADDVARHAERPVFLISSRMVATRIAGAYHVGDLMTRDVEYLREVDTVISAIRKLLRRGVGSAPVLDPQGRIIGVITEQDLLDWESRAQHEAQSSDGPDPARFARLIESETVGSIVNRHPATIEESAGIDVARRQLEDRGVRSLVVTRAGKLVGMLSREDILRGVAARWQSLSKLEPSSPT